MPYGYEGEVVRYLRQKDTSAGTGFGPVTWIGAEQCFVNALRNSNDNNLEEQYILGTDTYTEIEEDSNGNQVITKSFCIITNDSSPEDTKNYYQLVTIKYNQDLSDYSFEDNAFKAANNSDTHYGTAPNQNTFFFDNANFFEVTGSILRISGLSITQTDNLFFIDNSNNKIPVATKETRENFIGGKRIIREIVTNNL